MRDPGAGVLVASVTSSVQRRLRHHILLEQVPLRISVSGMRGKSGVTNLCERVFRNRGFSTLAKETGTRPEAIRDGRRRPIRRPARPGPILDENIGVLSKYWLGGMEVLIFENQGVSEYTMRVFNERFCRPHYVLLTNLRRDHLEDFAPTLARQARSFVRTVPRDATLISGEGNPALIRELREGCSESHVRSIDASPAGDTSHPPGFEAVTIVDALLKEVTGDHLSQDEVDTLRQRLDRHFRWERSRLEDVMWFNGAAVNDVDSTSLVLEYLQRERPIPVSFIAYFRRDRRDRTSSFEGFLRDSLEQDSCRLVYLAGHGAALVARRLAPWEERTRLFPDDVKAVPDLIERVAAECRGEAVMTIANGVPPFPREVIERLTRSD